MKTRIVLACLIAFFAFQVTAQPLWPKADYDPTVPTFDQVLGYEPGDRITNAADTLTYFQQLASRRPAQVRIFEYGRSWQGRTLFYVAIGNADTIGSLDRFEADMAILADPTTAAAKAAELADTMPASVWLAYSVHGNEISSTDAALMTGYHLLAAQDDAVVDEILQNTVVFINPLQNPDGRERFLFHHNENQGIDRETDRQAAQHDEPWPSGRVNHYLFDLNRDWLTLSQPETQSHVAAVRRWLPLVFVDLHEMGSDSSYYFAPEAVPYNPHLAADQRQNLELFGRNNAHWFDEFGIDYFTREVFDAFYPGYGASWPSYYGAVAMTYEQASAGGLAIRRRNGTILTYRDSVRNHFVASISTAQAVANNRKKLLADFHRYQTSAVSEGNKGVREYLISRAGDHSAADKLAGLLVQQGVKVRRSAEGFSACGQDYPAGSYAVSLAQSAKRLIRTLLDPQVDMEASFLAEQERRRSKDLQDQIYDVTGWSLPLMYGVTVNGCGRTVKGSFEDAGPELIQPGVLTEAGASVAYLVPWGSRAAVKLLAAAQRQGIRVRGSDLGFTLNGRDYPAGTLILPVQDNPVDLGPRLASLARSTGADVVGVSDSWVTDGPNFGSGNVSDLPAPRVALAWDAPTSPTSAGAARFVIERQFGYPVSTLRSDTLAGADLSRYDVVILPESRWSYPHGLSDNLTEWVNRGGVLIALGNALSAVTSGDNPLLPLAQELNQLSATPQREDDPDDNGKVAGSVIASQAEYEQAITGQGIDPDGVSGTLLRADVDTEHWLGVGVAPQVNLLLRGSRIYAPLRRDQGTTVAHMAAADELLASGFLWAENRQQLAFKPFVVTRRQGRGHVIGFTSDPNVRAYLDGLNVLFMNAVLRSTGHSRKFR